MSNDTDDRRVAEQFDEMDKVYVDATEITILPAREVDEEEFFSAMGLDAGAKAERTEEVRRRVDLALSEIDFTHWSNNIPLKGTEDEWKPFAEKYADGLERFEIVLETDPAEAYNIGEVPDRHLLMIEHMLLAVSNEPSDLDFKPEGDVEQEKAGEVWAKRYIERQRLEKSKKIDVEES